MDTLHEERIAAPPNTVNLILYLKNNDEVYGNQLSLKSLIKYVKLVSQKRFSKDETQKEINKCEIFDTVLKYLKMM